MLDALLQNVDPAAVAGALLLLSLQLLQFCAQCQYAQHLIDNEPRKIRVDVVVLPRLLPTTVPLIGHAVNYMREGHDYFSNLCRSTKLPIFTIRIAPISLTIVQPSLRQYLPKVRHLRLNSLVAAIFRRALAFGDHSCALLREELQQSHGFGSQVSRIFREEFIPNRNLRRYVLRLDDHIHNAFSDLVHRNSDAKIRIEEWVFSTVVGALGSVLWGESSSQKSPFSESEFLFHLKSMLQNMRALSNPVSLLIDRKLLESRRFVREALKSSAAVAEYPSDSLLGRLRSACDAHGAAPEDWTDFQLLLLAGALPNIVGGLAWTVHHLVAEPEWLASMREELTAYSDSVGGEIDLAEVPTRCPKLMATWKEVLRCHSGFSIARHVESDTTIASRWLLGKGTILVAPLRPYHIDAAVWGDDVDEFRPARFLKADGSLDESQRRKMKMFGLFGAMCPGRFLAANIAMSFMIRLISSVDICTIDGRPHVVPQEAKDSMVGLPIPEDDPEVFVRRWRQDPQEITIRLHSAKSASSDEE
ncbi:uncharacterized protein E0L32_003539 [Thyridium curvatum]|uniref:Cytochrome P450 n=1 Tax=Thyridium curvatum TaxID=1093900 RepID=A0A507BAS0_9PEZI|nr:uncharacterized protein E0L32_003539 [Thyridium curvatum]TPX16977.1 hypothetical protein E0L32_003539 [Thyridium curvatum]